MIELVACDNCGYRATNLMGAPCPRCGARERRPATSQELGEYEHAKWSHLNGGPDQEVLPRAYIRRVEKTKHATATRSEKHQERVREAHRLDRAGSTRAEIATALDVTPRTVYRLLAEEVPPRNKRLVDAHGHDIS